MDYHHVVEAAGAIALALVFYSYTWRWFDAAESPRRARWRPVVNGVAFGMLAVFLMMSRIQVGDGHWIDARAVPLALIALAVAVYAITWGSFVVLGPRGAAIFAPVWLPVLLLNVVGIGLVARLFGDVVAGRAAEAARRDAAQLRAVTLLARAAAHEINNPLTAVLGGLGLAARRVAPDSEEGKWIERAREGGERIRDIVVRMNRITQVEEAPQIGALPPILDLKKSSE